MTPRFHLLLLALASALTLGESHLLATTFSVGATPGCSFNSLEAALSALANDPDPNPTIRITAGLHQAVRVTIDRSVTIIGGYPSCVAGSPTPGARSILDAAQAGRVVTIRGASSDGPIEVQLVNLSLEKGRADLGGGLSVTQGATVTLDNVLVLANEATIGGGGIHFDGGSNATLTLLASGINGNVAPIGGGVLCRGSGRLVGALGTGIGGNRAATLGGGVRATGCEVTFAGPMTVSLNTAAHGGGIFLDGGAEASLEGGPGALFSIRENRATSGGASGGTGGGIAVSGNGTHLGLLNVTIERNRALHNDGSGGEGGGVMVSDHASSLLVGGRFFGSKATGSGGESPVCPGAMSCSVFRRNEARRGAALHVGFESEVNLINVEVVDNHAVDSIIATGEGADGDEVIRVEGVYLHRNTAAVLVAADGDSRVELTHVTASHNPELHHAIRTTRSGTRSPELRLRNNVFNDPVPVLDRAPGGTVTAECLFVADASGLGEFPAILTEDPQLVDPAAGDLHLGSGSPAVDRCSARHFFANHDSDGHERGVQNLGVAGDILGFDAGADELGTAREIFSDGFESGTLSAWGLGP